MAKWKRSVVGSILKGKLQDDGTTSPDYLKLKVGQYGKDILDGLKRAEVSGKDLILNLESQKSQLKGIDDAVKASRMSEETAEKVRERIAKIPDYVRFEIVLLQKQD